MPHSQISFKSWLYNADSELKNFSFKINVLAARHSKCLNHHNQRLYEKNDWCKFDAPNIWCFVMNFFVPFFNSFDIKIQANEGKSNF